MDRMVRGSVIVPNYTHALFLQQRIESVLNQSFQDFELILLDDCSTDGSREILEAYSAHPKVSHVVFNDINSGSPFLQWIKGFALAKGDLIWIAESDDYSSPYFLQKVVERFAKDQLLDVVFTGTTNIDEHNTDIGNTTRIERHKRNLYISDFSKPGHQFLIEFLPNYCIVRNVSSAVLKKQVITPLVMRVTEFNTVGDFYFWVALCLENRTFGFISEKLNFMRKHPGTVRQSKHKSTQKKEEHAKIRSLIWKKRWFDVAVSRRMLVHVLKN